MCSAALFPEKVALRMSAVHQNAPSEKAPAPSTHGIFLLFPNTIWDMFPGQQLESLPAVSWKSENNKPIIVHVGRSDWSQDRGAFSDPISSYAPEVTRS